MQLKNEAVLERLVGISSGANILASEKYMKTFNPPGIIITVLCDRGERYMSIL